MKRVWVLAMASSVLGVLVSGVLSPHVNSGVVGCGESETKPAQSHLTDMGIRTPLYLFDRNGRFVRSDLATGAETVLSEHGFHSEPEVRESADGRWISYSGELRGLRRRQYWLYDRETGRDQLVMEQPAWGGSAPAFSPDGHYLVIIANYDNRWPDAKAAGTYVFNTETLQRVRLGIPAHLTPQAAWTDAEWSRDGTRLLLVTLGDRPGKDTREYRSWQPGSTGTTSMEGAWLKDPQSGHDVWLEREKEIPTFEQQSVQGMRAGTLDRSPDGQWMPRLEEHGSEVTLFVTGRDGQSRKAAVEENSMCEGFAIAVVGWLDAGHLVYRKPGGLVRVYEPATGRTAPLQGEHEGLYLYGWRRPAPTSPETRAGP